MRTSDLATAATIYRIPVDAIAIPDDRLRSLKVAQADAIGAAIKADRQYDPISVAQLPGKESFVLVDGLHRLEGSRLHELGAIDAVIVPADREARLRQEILSAWVRADHDVFDSASQIKAMAELSGYRITPPATAKQADEEACAMMAQTLRWDIATAEALGIGRRSVFRHLRVLKAFSLFEIEMLRKLGLAAELVPLERLVALPPEQLQNALDGLLAETYGSIAEALAAAAPGTAPTFDKQKAKVLKQAEAWETAHIGELITELRAIYAVRCAKVPGA